MVCRHGDEGCAIQRIWAGCKHLDIRNAAGAAIAQFEAHARAFGPADPVLLHQPNTVRPAIKPLDRFKKIIGIFGDFQEPL